MRMKRTSPACLIVYRQGPSDKGFSVDYPVTTPPTTNVVEGYRTTPKAFHEPEAAATGSPRVPSLPLPTRGVLSGRPYRVLPARAHLGRRLGARGGVDATRNDQHFAPEHSSLT